MNSLHLLLSLGIGFAIGYVHTGIAIVMLFRPFEEVRFLGFRLQGMIPRRKAEMARSVSRIFTSDLLREESVAERIGGADVRDAFEALALDVARRSLGREYGSLRETLSGAGARVLERALATATAEAARALQAWLASPAGRAVLQSGFELLLDRTLEELLPGEDASLSTLLAAKGASGLASPDLEEHLRLATLRLLPSVAAGRRPLCELLPAEARAALLGAVRASVPAILQRFERVLVSATNVEKIKGAVRSGVRSYLLEMEGGLLKNLLRHAAILGRDRIFREVDAVVDANLYRLGELVYEEENRAHLEAGVCEALEAFLRRTPSEVLGAVAPETLERFAVQAATWAATRLRTPEVAHAVVGLLERELRRVFQTPLRELAVRSGVGEATAERLAGVGAASSLSCAGRRGHCSRWRSIRRSAGPRASWRTRCSGSSWRLRWIASCRRLRRRFRRSCASSTWSG